MSDMCPTHKVPLVKRPGSTYEQRWCGEWQQCPKCTFSSLTPSEALKHMVAVAAPPGGKPL